MNFLTVSSILNFATLKLVYLSPERDFEVLYICVISIFKLNFKNCYFFLSVDTFNKKVHFTIIAVTKTSQKFREMLV